MNGKRALLALMVAAVCLGLVTGCKQETAQKVAEDASELAHSAGAAIQEGVDSAAAATKDAAIKSYEEAKEAYEALEEAVSKAGASASAELKDKLSDLKAEMDKLGESIENSEVVTGAKEGLEKAGDALGIVRDKLKEMGEEIGEL